MAEPPPTSIPYAHLASPTVTAPSPQHLMQIADARVRGKKIRRCASIANGSAWTIVIFGAITVISGIGSVPAMVLGLAMCALSHFEFRGAKEVRKLNIAGPWHLARNQLILGAALSIYAAIALFSALNPSGGDPLSGEITDALAADPGMKQTADLWATIIYSALYGSVFLAAVLGCGGTAIYYARCKGHIEQYLRDTPPWILELERAGMTVY